MYVAHSAKNGEYRGKNDRQSPCTHGVYIILNE